MAIKSPWDQSHHVYLYNWQLDAHRRAGTFPWCSCTTCNLQGNQVDNNPQDVHITEDNIAPRCSKYPCQDLFRDTKMMAVGAMLAPGTIMANLQQQGGQD